MIKLIKFDLQTNWRKNEKEFNNGQTMKSEDVAVIRRILKEEKKVDKHEFWKN